MFDSDLTRSTYPIHEIERARNMRCNILDDSPIVDMPITLAKGYEISIKYADDKERLIVEEKNLLRNVLISVEADITEISFRIKENWGKTASTKLFTFEIY